MSLTVPPLSSSQIAVQGTDRSISTKSTGRLVDTQAAGSSEPASRLGDTISLSLDLIDAGAVTPVRQELGRAMSIADVSLAAGDGVVSLLGQIRQIAVAVKEGGDVPSGSAAFHDRLDRIEAVVSKAAFDGVNLLSGAASSELRLASESEDAPHVLLSSVDMSLGGPNVTLTRGMDFSTPQAIDDVLGAVDGSMSHTLSSLAELQKQAGRIQDHDEVLARAGLNLASSSISVDVDGEAAQLRALQIQQGLVSAKSAIAGASSGMVLSLFK